jgi:hypothetical protein
MAFRWHTFCLALLFMFAPAGAPHPTVWFDLPVPQIEVRVTRAGRTLPIAQVPNLQAGDRVRIHPNLPEEQSVRYITQLYVKLRDNPAAVGILTRLYYLAPPKRRRAAPAH